MSAFSAGLSVVFHLVKMRMFVRHNVRFDTAAGSAIFPSAILTATAQALDTYAIGYTLGFNKVLTRMIGGNPGIQQTACRAVYLSKRLAALQRIFRAHLYAVRIMPRRKRLITALGVVRNVDPDSRRMIMEMAGLANFRTTPPQPYTLWNHRPRSMSALGSSLGILVVEGYQPGDNVDDIVQEVFNLLQAQAGVGAA